MHTFRPLPEELLIGMYLLGAILKRCQNVEINAKQSGMPKEACDAMTGLWFSPISDLLWGKVSWKAQADPFSESDEWPTESYERLMRMLIGNEVIASCPFSLHLDPSRTELFEKKVLEILKNWSTETRMHIKGLKKIHAHFRALQKKRALSLKCSDAERLLAALFPAYHATMMELVKLAKEKQETDIRTFVLEKMDDCRFLAPEKLFLPNHKAIYRFLADYLDDYLQAFVERERIDWNLGATINLWKWPKQRQCTLDYLRKQQEDCSDEFFYSPAAAALPAESKPIETLFELVREKAVVISEIKLNEEEWRVEFKVVILEQSGTNRAKTPLVSTFEFMGTVSVNDNLSSKANPARNLHMKHGKQRYLWQYLRTTYGSDPQPRSAVEQYVSQKLGRGVTITKKDCENLITAISAYGNRPKDDIRSAFVRGETIGLKKID